MQIGTTGSWRGNQMARDRKRDRGRGRDFQVYRKLLDGAETRKLILS